MSDKVYYGLMLLLSIVIVFVAYIKRYGLDFMGGWIASGLLCTRYFYKELEKGFYHND